MNHFGRSTSPGLRLILRDNYLAVALLALIAVPACSSTTTQPEDTETTLQVEPIAQAVTTDSELADQALQDASNAIFRGDYASARLALQPLLLNPDYEARASYNLGVLDHMDGDVASAARNYERAFTADPTLVEAFAAQIRVLLSQGDVDGAHVALQRAISLSQNSPGVQAIGLQVMMVSGNYERVLTEARNVLLQDENNIDAHLMLAMAYHRLNQTELAKVVLREALVRDDQRVELWIELGNIQVDEGNEVAAIQSFRSALRVDPDAVEALNNLAVLQERARNHLDAIDHLERVVELTPDYVEAYINLSNAQKSVGDLEGAQTTIMAALAIDPHFGPAYFNLGLLYLDTEFPGMTRIDRLEAAVDNFNLYRNSMRSSMPQDDPVEEYLNEALAALETERRLGTEGGDSTDDPFGDDDFGDDDFGDDDFGDGDDWGDEEFFDEDL